MNQIIEVLRAGAASLLLAGGPTLVFGVVGAVSGSLLAFGILRLAARLAAWRRRGSVRVASLAARGASRAEIARRTGLSQDAVGMLLCFRAAARGRRNLPVPARIAASERDEARRRNRDWNPQVIVEAGVNGSGGRRRQSARALPSAPSTVKRLTRAQQAA